MAETEIKMPSLPDGCVRMSSLTEDVFMGWTMVSTDQNGKTEEAEIPPSLVLLKENLTEAVRLRGETFQKARMSVEAYMPVMPGVVKRSPLRVSTPAGEMLELTGQVADIIPRLDYGIQSSETAARHAMSGVTDIFMTSRLTAGMMVLMFADKGVTGQIMLNPAMVPDSNQAAMMYRAMLSSAEAFKDNMKSRFGVDVEPGGAGLNIITPGDGRWISKV